MMVFGWFSAYLLCPTTIPFSTLLLEHGAYSCSWQAALALHRNAHFQLSIFHIYTFPIIHFWLHRLFQCFKYAYFHISTFQQCSNALFQYYPYLTYALYCPGATRLCLTRWLLGPTVRQQRHNWLDLHEIQNHQMYSVGKHHHDDGFWLVFCMSSLSHRHPPSRPGVILRMVPHEFLPTQISLFHVHYNFPYFMSTIIYIKNAR